jgi:NADH:ubiquinone oxidoreductase subunit H
MDVAWKGLIPLALVNLLVTAAIVQYVRVYME